MKAPLALLLGLLGAGGGCSEALPPPPAQGTAAAPEDLPNVAYFAPAAEGGLRVWFLDVGHGDAILVRSPTGETVLIDGGPPEAGSRLAARLPELLSGPLDRVVVTRVHPDHYGALTRALQTVGVRRLLVPRTSGGPEEWEALLALAALREIPVTVPASPRPGEPLTLALGGGAQLVLYLPGKEEADSLVIRLVHGGTSALLAAGATRETERRLLREGHSLRSTLLKVAGNGADTASSEEFLAAVRPQAAVVSVGAGNGREAPARAVLQRLAQAGAEVFRTDLDGELRVDGDGKALVLFKERPAVGEPPDAPYPFGLHPPSPLPPAPPPPPAPAPRAVARPKARSKAKQVAVGPPVSILSAPAAPASKVAPGAFVATRYGEVFHLPHCPNAQRIKEQNLIVYRTRAEAARERRAAGDCNP